MARPRLPRVSRMRNWRSKRRSVQKATPFTMSTQQPVSLSSISLYDERPFFEKALQFGVQNRIIDQPKLDAICADAPKGMVQIARYFGSEFLRPELEKAKDRIVNLVSLYLESTSGGDLRKAAESLQRSFVFVPLQRRFGHAESPVSPAREHQL
ncbi:hypothetical protein LP416_06290 [Polaromonas sp. P2-4]|nr:hypothetical protein LP416_06290 [Polaromonas sp. P2-4]